MLRWKITVVLASLAAAAFTLLPFSFPGQISTPPPTSYASDIQIQSKHSPVDFLPDGNLSKPSWKLAKSVKFDSDSSGKSHYPELSTRIASLWTGKYIYFAFWARYDSLNIYDGEDPKLERWELWNRDVVEVFLNASVTIMSSK